MNLCIVVPPLTFVNLFKLGMESLLSAMKYYTPLQ